VINASFVAELCVCVCVCVCVRARACACVRARACACVRAHVRACVHISFLIPALHIRGSYKWKVNLLSDYVHTHTERMKCFSHCTVPHVAMFPVSLCGGNRRYEHSVSIYIYL